MRGKNFLLKWPGERGEKQFYVEWAKTDDEGEETPFPPPRNSFGVTSDRSKAEAFTWSEVTFWRDREPVLTWEKRPADQSVRARNVAQKGDLSDE